VCSSAVPPLSTVPVDASTAQRSPPLPLTVPANTTPPALTAGTARGKAALLAGIKYAEGRGAVEFEATDSASAKALYVYRLLVHDKLIAPMPEDQVGEKTVRHRLATWYMHQLPKGHPLRE